MLATRVNTLPSQVTPSFSPKTGSAAWSSRTASSRSARRCSSAPTRRASSTGEPHPTAAAAAPSGRICNFCCQPWSNGTIPTPDCCVAARCVFSFRSAVYSESLFTFLSLSGTLYLAADCPCAQTKRNAAAHHRLSFTSPSHIRLPTIALACGVGSRHATSYVYLCWIILQGAPPSRLLSPASLDPTARNKPHSNSSAFCYSPFPQWSALWCC